MRKLVLHIGMHKTGTSSIQQTMFDNRAFLEASGINYLSSHVNHSVPIYSLFSEAPHRYHINVQAGFDTPDKCAVYNKTLESRLAGLFETNTSPLFVISGEDLSVIQDGGVERLHEFLRRYFDEIVVLGYVRPPKSFISSIVQESLKSGRHISAQLLKEAVPNYRARFEKYFNVFGMRNVTLHLFHPERLFKHDILDDFLYRLGLSESLAERLTRRTTNQSISMLAGKFLHVANRTIPRFCADDEGQLKVNVERAKSFSKIVSDLPGEKFLLPELVMNQAVDSIGADITWIEGRVGESLSQFDIVGTDGDLDAFESFTFDELSQISILLNQVLKDLDASSDRK